MVQCDYFQAGSCRSCTLLGTPYRVQIRDKLRRTEKTLAPFTQNRAGFLPEAHLASPKHNPQTVLLDPFRSSQVGFRNHAKMVVSGSKKQISLGLAPTPRLPQGVDLEECPLYPPAIRQSFAPVRQWLALLGARPYQIAQHKGELRYVLVRANPAGEVMVRLVLRSHAALRRVENTLPELQDALEGLKVFSVNVQPEHTALIAGREEIVLTSQRFLSLPGVGRDLLVAPGAFFQTNTEAAQEMYRQAAAWALEIQPETAWDLYCGVGGFAFALAHACPDVQATGVELAGAAIDGARQAATGGQLHFITADARKWIQNQKHTQLPDLLVVNPPRAGLGAELSTWIEQSGIPRVIYSSCFLPSLTADLRRLASYRLKAVKLIDMFPHTSHTETMCLLSRD